ncbi:hypothetical protein LM602_09280, partial [Candidatus Acetothermia bacterium]|nr:hypothetical protein [Candidatus Acetothermia bacterium]
SVYCPELDLYTDGITEQEAQERFASLLLEYYGFLIQHPDKLDESMREHLVFYERELLPELLSLTDEHGWYTRHLLKQLATPKKRAGMWQKALSSNLVRLSPA